MMRISPLTFFACFAYWLQGETSRIRRNIGTANLGVLSSLILELTPDFAFRYLSSNVRTLLRDPGRLHVASKRLDDATRVMPRREAERLVTRARRRQISGLLMSVQDPTKSLEEDNKIPKSKILKLDYVVHYKYGVGRFLGLAMDKETGTKKVLKIEYYGREILEISPKEARKMLRLYQRSGESDRVRLDDLHDQKNWENRKKKAAKKITKVALELCIQYSERSVCIREPCPEDGERYKAFTETFTYEPTPDQRQAFEDIRVDMVVSKKPMDRLVCGDVGFGKTEVASRAIYRTICSGKQVGLLAPTTVLASQHLKSMRKRMPDIRIEMVSSLIKRTAKDRAALMRDLSDGDIDMLVGTHALLARNVSFGDLGLLVVDEEQRFGVKQKEALKNISMSVDVLTLSATPIPRTMYMCLAGIRNMTKLKTPPKGRQPVETTVSECTDQVLSAAVKRELNRGGQVFLIVPRIAMIDREVERLEELFPNYTIDSAHGKTPNLESKVVAFTDGEVDIMISTAIFENGIDIPNVNTMIIQEAQYFGMAQLHQLRGRVGRSSTQAYAYLFHPPRNTITAEGAERLDSLQRLNELGQGQLLAERDMQMRGYGDLFGTEQKGTSAMGDLGRELYFHTLTEMMKFFGAVREKNMEVDDRMNEKIMMDIVNGAEMASTANATLGTKLMDPYMFSR